MKLIVRQMVKEDYKAYRGLFGEAYNEHLKNASEINQIFSTIIPDNEALIKLHEKAGFNVKDWKIASLRISD